MTQLILNGVSLPETSNDNYKCYPVDLGESLRMISGRLVNEVSATVMDIEYAYDCLPDDIVRPLLFAARTNAEIEVIYLTPETGTMAAGTFKITKKPVPQYAFSIGDEVFWHDISFKLEGVDGLD